MVNFQKFFTASMSPTFLGLKPNTPSLANSLDSVNNTWGFSPDSNKKFRLENGTIKVGNITLDEFNSMSASRKVEYLQSDAFDASSRPNLDSIDSNFVDAKLRTKAIEMGRPGLETAKKQVTSPDGSINTSTPSWTNLMKNVTKVSLLGAGVVWTLSELNSLIEGNSGCFLEGPNGEQERLGGPDTPCNCLATDSSGSPNPLRQSCCTACKKGGDSSLICPSDSPTDTWNEPYVCPEEDAQPSQSKPIRSAISMSASAALARATTLSQRNVASESAEVTCRSCGCSDEVGMWKLCTRKATLWSVIGDIVAGAGKIIKDVGGGILELADVTLGGIGDALKSVFLYAGVAIGVCVVIASAILIARAVKKKKQRQRLLGGGRSYVR
jgi:hypothetical protein